MGNIGSPGRHRDNLYNDCDPHKLEGKKRLMDVSTKLTIWGKRSGTLTDRRVARGASRSPELGVTLARFSGTFLLSLDAVSTAILLTFEANSELLANI
jgi:hypothetical protein